MDARHGDSARLYSPSAGRNKAAIAECLGRLLPQGGRVLEIGSGTGEHAVAICSQRPDLIWQPSDPDTRSRESQDDWAKDLNGRMKSSLALDTRDDNWTAIAGSIDAIVCCNVIHIAPWSAAEGLARGAETMLRPGAPLILYGPYLEAGNSAPSNLDFDRSLRARNAEWGVRELEDVKALMTAHGFEFKARIDMPANNLLLVFERRAS